MTKKPPIGFTRDGGAKPELWACGNCGKLWTWHKPGAESCCCCCECGELLSVERKGWARCPACEAKRSAERDATHRARLLRECKTIGGSDYTYDIETNEWHDIDWWEYEKEDDEDFVVPDFGTGTKPWQLSLDMQDIIENLLCDEFCDDYKPDLDYKSLQALVDGWMAEQPNNSFTEDETKLVPIGVSEEELRQMVAEAKEGAFDG